MEKSNMLFIVSAGNDGVELGKDIYTYPAMFELSNVIVVGDLKSNGKPSNTSNYSAKYVDIFAPGTDILSLVGDDEQYISGTSCATAIVSAVCGIVASKYNMNNYELKEYICSNASGEKNIQNLET